MSGEPGDFTGLPDLASRALGGTVMYANDEFFADAHNLIEPRPAGHDPAAFGTRGKVYDGWETRRRREPGDGLRDRPAGRARRSSAASTSTPRTSGATTRRSRSVDGATLLGYPSAAEVLRRGLDPAGGPDRPRR